MFRKFEYIAPRTKDELVSALSRHKGARILAGGTDLLLDLREEVPAGTVVVDLKPCCEGGADAASRSPESKDSLWSKLRGIKKSKDGGLWIGALTTIREIQESPLVRAWYPALSDAADAFGCLEIRYRATIGGNVAHASPGAEYGTPLFAYEAQVTLAGPEGTRTVPIDEFWLDVGKTALAEGEFVYGFSLPPFPKATRSRYKRISRTKGMDLAAMGITVVAFNPGEGDLSSNSVPVLEDTHHRQIRIALGAVERTPVRMKAAEKSLSGKEIDHRLLEEVKKEMADSIHPRATSLRAGPEYKKTMVGVLTERILREFGIYEG